MFERFTDRSRRVIVLAQEEARLLNHNYIGTEHLLLGLLADEDGDAARTLESLDITLEAARHEVREILGEGRDPAKGHIPFTPRAKRVLELALREALTLRSQTIGSVHLLLGLVSEAQGVGAQVIERLGAPLATVRERAAEFAGHEPDPVSEAGAVGWPRPARVRIEGLAKVHETLAAIDRRLARIERHLGIAPEPEAPAAAGPPPPGAAATAAAPPEGVPPEGGPATPATPPTVAGAPATTAAPPAAAPSAAAPPATADPSAPEGPAAPDEPADSG